MEQNENPLEQLKSQVQLLSGEVDTLQKAVLGQTKPWYKQAATLISVLALLFSFGTTYVSDRRTDAQDIHNSRTELRALLQRMAVLPKENFEITQKYAGNAVAQNLLSAYLNQENALLSRQAAEIAKKLPKDKVSATEYYAVALALQSAYNLDSSKEFLKLALESAKDFNDEIGVLRTSANLLFITGKPEAGRVEYQKALDIFSKYPGYDNFVKGSTHIWTELSWSFAERNLGLMDLCTQHIANAEHILTTLSPGPGTDQLRNQIDQAKSGSTSGKSLTNPSLELH
jgi:tetratricopeptide (TPR) repeat protein